MEMASINITRPDGLNDDWSVEYGANGGFSVNRVPMGPNEQLQVILLVVISIAACTAVLWVSPKAPLAWKIAGTATGAIMCCVICFMLYSIDAYLDSLGPYIKAGEECIIIRPGSKVSTSDIDSTTIVTEWVGDGYKGYFLSLNLKSGRSLKVLFSWDLDKLANFGKQLDEFITQHTPESS